VRSALEQDEVEEILIIDDCSNDGGIQNIRKQFSPEPRIKYLSSGEIRKGSGAARNVGLANARFDFISFLDADDYMLPNRFENTKRVFTDYPHADGVYETLGEEGSDRITMLKESVSPEDLFFTMEPFGKKGHFSVCGLTMKRESIQGHLKFSERLEIGEDTEWLARLTLTKKLLPGDLERSVVMRRIHSNNITTSSDRAITDKVLMSKLLIKWSVSEKKSPNVSNLLAEIFLKYHFEENHIFNSKPFLKRKLTDLRAMGFLLALKPRFLALNKVKYFLKTIVGIPVKNHLDYYDISEGD